MNPIPVCRAILNVINGTLHYKGGPEFPIHIKSLRISPDPPKPGENLTINAIGEASETIEARVARFLRYSPNLIIYSTGRRLC